MTFDMHAEGDNGVSDRTSPNALDDFHDRATLPGITDPADPHFPAVLVVLGGDSQGKRPQNRGEIVGVRATGGAEPGHAAPGVVGIGGASGGSPGVVGV